MKNGEGEPLLRRRNQPPTKYVSMDQLINGQQADNQFQYRGHVVNLLDCGPRPTIITLNQNRRWRFLAFGEWVYDSTLFHPRRHLEGYMNVWTDHQFWNQAGELRPQSLAFNERYPRLCAPYRWGARTYDRQMRLHPSLERFWHKYTARVLLAMLSAIVLGLFIFFITNPFAGAIRSEASEISELLANLGESAEEGLYNVLVRALTVVVYFAVPVAAALVAIYLIVGVLYLTLPHDNFKDELDGPAEEFKDRFDQSKWIGRSKRNGRWYLLRFPEQVQVRDSRYSTMPSRRRPLSQRLSQNILTATARKWPRAIGHELNDEELAAMAPLNQLSASVSKVGQSGDNKSLIYAASELARAITSVVECATAEQQADDNSPYASFRGLLNQQQIEANDDPFQVIDWISEQQPPPDSLADQTVQVCQVIRSAREEARDEVQIIGQQPATGSASSSSTSSRGSHVSRFFRGVDLASGNPNDVIIDIDALERDEDSAARYQELAGATNK